MVNNAITLFNSFHCLDGKVDKVAESSKADETGLKQNLSSSELKKFSSAQGRDSLTSVESDITVLVRNSSHDGVEAISETSQENAWLDDSPGELEQAADNTHGSVAIGTNELDNHVTPVGSPLSTVVCLSMVSSVYKNTLSGNGENTDANDSKTNERNSYEDDIIAEPVLKRKSKKSVRKSKNREVTIYDSVPKSVELSTGADSSLNTFESIYDISNDSRENQSHRRNKNETSIPSIYDTAVSDPDQTDSKFESLDSSNQNSADMSHDLLSVNQMSNSHSSPLRRRGSFRSRSRSSSRNRSAIYGDSSAQDLSGENILSKSDIPEFPSELSPIKRTGSRRSRENNRSALLFDNNSISDSLSTALSSTATDEVSGASYEKSVAEDTSATSVQLPWEKHSSQSGDGTSKHKDESLNHDEFINIDHK